MDVAGQHLLAGSGLALNQDRRFRAGYQLDHRLQLAHGLAESEEQRTGDRDPHGLRRFRLVRAEDSLEGAPEAFVSDGLAQEVAGSDAHGLDHQAGRGRAGNDDDRQAPSAAAQLAQHLKAIAPGKHDVQQHGGDGHAHGKAVQSFLAIRDGFDAIALAAQGHLEVAADFRIVRGHQNEPVFFL